MPGLVVSRIGAVLLLESDVVTVFKEKDMLKAVTTLLGTFYLLDLDYPPGWLMSLSILQKVVFGDKKVHPDAKGDIVKTFNDLERYCSGEWFK